ncbi:uncharacterized protein LOC135843853 [Planococcus citri]|uniref:uncharacterized protein LOC135843853 n=1 Tax=Planococcus citri TaxID=170843 RepID=UPI0031F776DD
MDSGPQAFGLGRVSGQVDFQQFLKSRPVLILLLCLKFSIIAYFCISPGSKITNKYNQEICIYSENKESTCYVGMQVTLLGIVEAIVFLCAEYFMWKSSSVKHRRRIIRAGLGIGGVECFFCFIAFLYIFFTWVGTPVPNNVSTANANFAILFIFLDIFAWGYFTLLEYQRLEKGVDPEFMGSFGTEDAAQFSTYAAEENEYQDPNIPK